MPDARTEVAEMVATLHPGVRHAFLPDDWFDAAAEEAEARRLQHVANARRSRADDEREDAFVLATREREG